MSKTEKIQKECRFHGFGFPVVLQNVPMKKIRGEWVPYIDFNLLERIMAVRVALKQGRLTGSELRFLRLHLDFGQKDFGEQFDYTRQGVKRWEDCADRCPSLKWSTERDIRLFVLSRMKIKPAGFYRAYEYLQKKGKSRRGPMKVPADTMKTPGRVLEELLAA